MTRKRPKGPDRREARAASPALMLTTLLTLMAMGLVLWGCGRGESFPMQVPVEALSVNAQSVMIGEEVVVTGTVVNSLSSQATYPVRLWVNGVLVQTIEVTVQPRAQEVVTFQYVPLSPGMHQFRLGKLTTEVTVLGHATFSVSCLVVKPESARVGTPITVEATVYNTGDVGGAYQADFAVNNESVGKQDIAFESGREQRVVSFQYTPQATGAATVGVGGLMSSFTALPADGSLLPPPTGLGDVKVIYATGIADSPTGGFQHIHGVTYDRKKNTMWAADHELSEDLFEVDTLACDNARVTPSSRLHLQFNTKNPVIQDVAIDVEDGTIYYLNLVTGKLRQIDQTGKALRELDIYNMTVVQGEYVQKLGSAYSIVVQSDYLWVGTEALLVQLDKKTFVQTGKLMEVQGTGAAYDPDRNLIWSGDWLDCTFEAFDPDTGELVFQSKVVELPAPDPTGCHRGHNLAYGGGRLWVGTESFDEDFLYGIRVE